MSSQLVEIKLMQEACEQESLKKIKELIEQNPQLASLQDPSSGKSPLMICASQGSTELLSFLLSNHAPWNALDKNGKCAGNYAVDGNHQDCIDLLVNHAVQAELILNNLSSHHLNSISETKPLNKYEEPCTKPDYLSKHKLTYSNRTLVDNDGDAVMMEWERPLMSAHASIITSQQKKNARVLNVGFGMGIIDSILQAEYEPTAHVIIEAHEDVYNKMIRDGWDKKNKSIKIYFGTWQKVIPKLLEESNFIPFDGIFWDTYGEDFSAFQLWNSYIPKLMSKRTGVYSYFNGFCPDNIFFQGVISQITQIQLQSMQLHVEFYPCEIQVNKEEWKDIKREYWFQNTYYLPVITWCQDAEEAS